MELHKQSSVIIGGGGAVGGVVMVIGMVMVVIGDGAVIEQQTGQLSRPLILLR